MQLGISGFFLLLSLIIYIYITLFLYSRKWHIRTCLYPFWLYFAPFRVAHSVHPACSGILLKNGRLTDDEYTEIKRHPAASADILLGLSNMQDLVPIVRAHHEFYNGKGYPDGLKEDEIPFASRIIAVADSFDAMVSKRAYRDGMPIEKAKAEIERCKGTQFDPKIADAFLAMIAEHGDEVFLQKFSTKGE